MDHPQCLLCLGDHHSSNCNTKNCFQCNQTGHIARECRAPKVRCRKCGNKGHPEEDCGVIMFLNSSGIRFDHKFRERYGLGDLMGVRCLANCRYPLGHFNCHQYSGIKDEFYPQATIEKIIVRENYLLSNVNKLRECYFKQAAKAGATLKSKIASRNLTLKGEREEGTDMSDL